jgi:hypothetical protein
MECEYITEEGLSRDGADASSRAILTELTAQHVELLARIHGLWSSHPGLIWAGQPGSQQIQRTRARSFQVLILPQSQYR